MFFHSLVSYSKLFKIIQNYSKLFKINFIKGNNVEQQWQTTCRTTCGTRTTMSSALWIESRLKYRILIVVKYLHWYTIWAVESIVLHSEQSGDLDFLHQF